MLLASVTTLGSVPRAPSGASPRLSKFRVGRTLRTPCVASSASTSASVNAGNDVSPTNVSRRHLLLLASLAGGLSAGTADVRAAMVVQQLAAPVPFPAKVFVAGATGETGRRVVAQLCAAGVNVVAGVRSIDKAKKLGLDAKGATLVKSNVLDGTDVLAKTIGDAGAVVCCVSFAPSFNLAVDNPGKIWQPSTDVRHVTSFEQSPLRHTGSLQVDGQGTISLIDASKKAGVKKFVLVSSLLTNAPAVGQSENPNYKFLNALGGVLDQKRAAELYLEQSGLDWTVVRPGGLSNEAPGTLGPLLIGKADQFLGLDEDPGRVISRDTVAEVCIQALVDTDSKNRIVEIVTSNDKSAKPIPKENWF